MTSRCGKAGLVRVKWFLAAIFALCATSVLRAATPHAAPLADATPVVLEALAPGASDTTLVALGEVEIPGVGKVTLAAKRTGVRLVIHARDAHGSEIGRAETVVGLNETRLYVSSPSGLRAILIRWKTQTLSESR